MDSSTPHALSANPTTQRVVGKMKHFAHGAGGKENLDLRALCEEIVADVEPGDYCGEALACYYWVCDNIRYTRDILGVEFVKWPIRTLETGQGDCDDIAVLLAAMLMSLGNRCRFVLAGFDATGAPSHVFCAIVLPDGSAVTLDPVANRVTRAMLGDVKARYIIDVGSFEDERVAVDAGLGYEDGGGTQRDPYAGRRAPRTFSVWDYGARQYDYYVADAPLAPATGGYRKPRARTPEGLAAKLPAGAAKTGSGKDARGTVASLAGVGPVAVEGFLNRPLLGAFTVKQSLVGAGVAGALWLGWSWWRGRDRRRTR